MPRQVLQHVENSFVKGLVTQASGLNFPENACTDTDNCIFNETGSVTRRKGIDFEPQFEPLGVNRSNTAMTSFVWKNVADDANKTLLVQQIGDLLFFHDALTYANISLGLLFTTVDLNDFTPAGGVAPDRFECQFANGHGVLFVFHPFCEPFYVEFDDTTGTATATQISVEIRDFSGVDDDLAVTERPALAYGAITANHHYNLQNQGWTPTNITAWDTARNDLPSNADIMFLYKNSSDAFDASTVANVMQGNTPAPKGHFIFSAFNQDRITTSGIGGITENPNTGTQRMSTGAFFAGRVWYSGINTQSYKGNVYFSQIVRGFDQFGKCYQANDPTAEDFADLLPNDGGVIDIADAGTVYKLFATQSSLLVFASNGVWAISGSTGLGFTSNDYSVSKIADIPSVSGSSFVNVAGSPMWWNYDGIYTIAPGQGGGFSPRSLTEGTIRDFYQDDIPEESKLYAKGCYNNILKTVQWIFRDIAASDIDDNYDFNRIVTLNLNTQAWYPWSIEAADPWINGIFFVESVPETIAVDNVVDGSGNQVVDGSGNDVIVYSKSGIISPRNVYITTTDEDSFFNLQFAVEADTDYQDWGSFEAVDYDSYFVTGYKIHGKAQQKFQSNYVFLYMNSEEDGSFKIRGLWDYALTADTNRWSSQQTINYDGGDYAYSKRRIKIRGNGHVLQFRVDSNGGDPFDVTGWSVWETVNGTI